METADRRYRQSSQQDHYSQANTDRFMHSGRVIKPKNNLDFRRKRLDSRDIDESSRQKIMDGIADFRAHQRRQDGEARARSILSKDKQKNNLALVGSEVILPGQYQMKAGEFVVVKPIDHKKMATNSERYHLNKSDSVKQMLPKLRLEEIRGSSNSRQKALMTLQTENNIFQNNRRSTELDESRQTPRLSARSSVTRSIRQIISHREPVALIQTSRLVHEAVKQKLGVESQGLQSQIQSNTQPLSLIQTEQTKQPVSRFLQRVGQLTERGARVVEAERPQSRCSKEHSYRAPYVHPSTRVEAAISARTKLPKKPSLVVKQRLLIREQNSKSPFLEEPSQVREESDEIFKPSFLPRDSEGAPKRQSFLPLEVFDPKPDIDPASLLVAYADNISGRCYGQSKWLFQDNRPAELRKCEVLSYNEDTEMYLIRWLCNSTTKHVTRFNLVFDLESADAFEARKRAAEQARHIGDMLMMYHYQIDNIRVQGKPVKVADEIKTRISFRILSHSPYQQIWNRVLAAQESGIRQMWEDPCPIRWLQPLSLPPDSIEKIHSDLLKQGLKFDSLGQLFEELDDSYLRTFKKIIFEAEIPYSEDKQRLFRCILPPEKLVPISDRTDISSKEKQIVFIKMRALPFKTALARAKANLHIAIAQKLEIMTEVHVRMEKLEAQNLFILSHKHPVTCIDFVVQSRRMADEMLLRAEDQMNDTQYKLEAILATEGQRVRDINKERRHALTHASDTCEELKVSPLLIKDIKAFSTVLNMQYEAGLRQCLQRSLEQLEQELALQIDLIEQVLGRPITDQYYCELSEYEVILLTKDAELNRRFQNQTFQFAIALNYKKSLGQIEISPSLDLFIQEIIGYIRVLERKLNDIPCILTTETGFARELHPPGKSKVMPDCMNNYVPHAIKRIEAQLKALSILPKSLEKLLDQHAKVLSTDTKKYVAWLKEADKGLEQYAEELQKLTTGRLHLEQVLFEDPLNLGPFVVNCSNFKTQFLNKSVDLCQKVYNRIKKGVAKTCGDIEHEVEKAISVLDNRNIKDIEELTEVRQFVKDLPLARLRISNIIQEVNRQLSLLDEYQCKRSEEEIQQTWISFAEPLRIGEHELDCKLHLEEMEKEFYVQLRVMNETLAGDIDAGRKEFESLQTHESLKEHILAENKVAILTECIENCKHIAEVSRRREKLFDVRLSDFEKQIEQLETEFAPFSELWGHARLYYDNINKWMKGPLSEIDRDVLTQEITEASAGLLKLARNDFKEKRALALVAMDLRQLYDNFRPYLPLVVALRSPFLKTRHWTSIYNLRKPPLQIQQDLQQSLGQVIEMGVMEYIEEINEISHFAAREKKLEEMISAMKDEWRNVKFEIIEHKDAETYLLHKPEPIWELLDEHILKTMAISGSPYVKLLRSEVNYWKTTLVRVQDVLEEWGRLQRTWMYLYPIFSSPDIQKELPTIFGQFAGVDRMWRLIMATTFANPLVLDACFQSRLMENLQTANETLEVVQRGLTEFLGRKRMAFPRFFFLPNEDLLQILSNAKDPLRVQPHLNKIFEGIHRLVFAEGVRSVLGMTSQMGEHVEFANEIELMQLIEEEDQDEDQIGERLKPVEKWLKGVETEMRNSLKYHTSKSLDAVKTQERKDWLFSWPSQVVLSLDQCLWTKRVEQKGLLQLPYDPSALESVLQIEQGKLSELVDLARSVRGGKARDNMTLGSLIVLGVHSKDVIDSLLKVKVLNIDEFEWVSQMRNYVIRSNDDRATKKIMNLEIEAKMVTATRTLGFEYLGNQPRLVITPLTDRCFRTLMVALQLNLGGAPEGPAGTGKTETTKDLAKALTKQCLVFNCSDQLDVDTMGKFFRGLACCGAWACFDEFNRIEVEVLSVVASQIHTIQIALMRRRPAAAFTFEDDDLILDPTCAVFITMNPGYAGRTELPDNLKTLFRPVAMMVPNYAIIAEISLYSFGFQRARELSVKITMSLKLASEQLSTQPHYDYGMRAVKSIISAAGRRKEESPDDDEFYLALRSIAESSIPKFIAEDVPLFEAILSDLFPDSGNRSPDNSELLSAFRAGCAKNNLDINPEVELKAIQLYQTLQVRHGLMLVGATMSGKTTILKQLARALEMTPRPVHVSIEQINPKAQAIGKLYGDVDPLTFEWSDGILARIVREAALDESNFLHWITLDGPVDAVWVENLNTVLDDNKKLCLPSSEIIKFHDRMTMVFEVADLVEASPATVSRCGMVHFTPQGLGWQVQIKPWISQLPNQLKKEWTASFITDLIYAIVPPALKWLLDDEGPGRNELIHQTFSENWLVKSFLTLLEALLLKGQTRASLEAKEQEERDRKEAKEAVMKLGTAQVDSENQKGTNGFFGTLAARAKALKQKEMVQTANLVVLAAAWGFGSMLRSDHAKSGLSLILTTSILGVKALDEVNDGQNQLVGPEMSVYDFVFDTEENVWVSWKKKLNEEMDRKVMRRDTSESFNNSNEGQNESQIEQSSSSLVPTPETLRYRYLLDQLLRISVPVCLIGPTGSGKSSLIKEFVTRGLRPEEWERASLVLSATTSAQFVQTYIESKLEKQRKGVYGPVMQGKRLLIFLDDLGMPDREQFGAQPPLELIRTLMSDTTLFDLKDTNRKHVVNTVFVGAMGIAEGGRTLPSDRLLRHFNMVCLPELSEEGMIHVFSQILSKGMQNYPRTWQNESQALAELSVNLYSRIKRELLPTPAKAHYQFNVRQVSEHVQGLLMVTAQTVESSPDQLKLLQKLWVHEARRVFSDRLVSEADKNLVEAKLEEVIRRPSVTMFSSVSLQNMGMNPSRLLFCNFLEPGQTTYELCISSVKTQKAVSELIEAYNSANPRSQLKGLQIFSYMIEHLSRISRIIVKPRGHGLLVSLGGNGRTVLTKLAAFLNQYTVFKAEFSRNYGRNEWIDEMKQLFKRAGIEDETHVFVIQAAEAATCPGAIEDVASITNSGEIPNLYGSDDLEEIKAEMQRLVKAGAGIDPLALFANKCRQNVHVLLSISPAGDILREYLRKYPALGHCTTFDWFLPWPEEALHSIALATLHDESRMQQLLGILPSSDPNLRVLVPQEYHSDNGSANQTDYIAGLARYFVSVHSSVVEAADKFYATRGRRVYLTPARLKQALALFSRILNQKSMSVGSERSQYLNGVKKLEQANVTVDRLQEELEKLGPELEIKSKAVEEGVAVIEMEAMEVAKTEAAAAEEALLVGTQAADAEAIKKDCEARLAEAQPQFESALLALRTLKITDFQTLRSFVAPPQPIRLALEAACIMLGHKPKIVEVAGPKGQKIKTADYWEKSRKLLADYMKFLNSLEKFDKDNINADRLNAIQKYLDNPDFIPEKIKKASEAAEGICKWVIAVCNYNVIAREVKPKREALAAAQEKHAAASTVLEEKEREVEEVRARRDALIEKQQMATNEKLMLEKQKEMCIIKLKRASQLMEALSSERQGWIQASQALGKAEEALVGDTVLAACFMSYLGPFEANLRTDLVDKQWKNMLGACSNLKSSNKFDLCKVMGDQQEIQNWILKGLPDDKMAAENMLIMENTNHMKWPLLIDPDEQALAFIREHLGSDHLPIKASSSSFARQIEIAMQHGAAVVCTHIGELNQMAMLTAILGREIITVAGNQYIKVEDAELEYHPDFNLYLFSSLNNPHISPGVQAKVQMLDFTVTAAGLSTQLLALVCKNECQKEEEEKHRLHKQDLQFKQQKKDVEKLILKLLTDTGDDLLEDETLLTSMDSSKKLAIDINQKLEASRHLSARIESQRKAFRPVAVHGARLYFAVQSLSLLDPMYQFSMAWFRDLFKESLRLGQDEVREKDPTLRGQQLKQRFRALLFEGVTMSLFSRHQLAFAFLMAVKVHEEATGALANNEEAENLRVRLKELDTSSNSRSIGRRQTGAISSSKKSDSASQRGSERQGIERHRMTVVQNSNQSHLSILQEEDKLSVPLSQLSYLLTGLLDSGAHVEDRPIKEDCKSFIDEKTWAKVLELATFDSLESLPDEIEQVPSLWRIWMKSTDNDMDIPAPYNDPETPLFAIILLTRVLKPHQTMIAIKLFVERALGPEFVHPSSVNLKELYDARSKATTPMLLLLTPGNDPMEAICRLAEERLRSRHPLQISLGKGQAARARAIIEEARAYGGWAVLQNCHLAPSYMDELAQVVDQLQPSLSPLPGSIGAALQDSSSKSVSPPHPEFRLWLTSLSTTTVPQSIVSASLKLTSEPPQGIKASLVRSYKQAFNQKRDKELHESTTKPTVWGPLSFALTMFHSVVRERRKFGVLGWNNHYDFNDSDLKVSMRQLHLMVEQFDTLPLKALRYLAGECNYGGRVTDDQDRRTLSTMLLDFYNQEAVTQAQTKGYNFVGPDSTEADPYRIVVKQSLEEYLEHVISMPETDSPTLLGLHPSARISLALLEADQIISCFGSVSHPIGQTDKQTSEQQSSEAWLQRIESLKDRAPASFDEAAIRAKFPFLYDKSMNVVLVQEVARYNRLLSVVRKSLNAVMLAVQGRVVATAETEATLESLLMNRVPQTWAKRAYPSLKPLASWMNDLAQRTRMLQKWIDCGQLPSPLWLSGLYFPQSFLTAAKQDYARRFKYSIDMVSLRAEIGNQELADQQKSKLWITGMLLEGAKWDSANQFLDEPQATIRHQVLPPILLTPHLLEGVANHPDDLDSPSMYSHQEQVHMYACPVYRTGERRGTLATTGHSTNFVMHFSLPSTDRPEKWIKRGTAILLASSD